MNTQASFFAPLKEMQRWALDWLTSWWQLVHFAVLVASLALMPSSYRAAQRTALARHLVLGSAPHLLWFSLLATLISLVIIRVVVVTSASYGLSRYALEMVVRVLVLELIPLIAALFVALRSTLPAGVEFARLSAAGERDARYHGVTGLRREFFPRAVSGIFAVWLLGAISCVLTLVLAYLSIYGINPYALQGYTRVVGQIFNPAVTLILVLKIVFFSFAVGLIPLASAYHGSSERLRHVYGLSDMVRMFSVLLLIEAASLMGNYY
ncbi:MlaE family ABC transporter permease [Pseudoduganella namucuonensis]|uniref:Phospholipid/cholesterol/gamma-HCH transport system permease protein n=1 Tax=Pseudoduganella namucuonensis TaxID=1035707 RepID=A0A1I7JKY2_9BURK|nr:ABC transporter permease [Pseudoduganella namucuonensis]SFU85807.1 phospholipid/cholesterol/gamma-HCH transport system permease protein [Pseudoduganella namucuonensis]